MFTCTQRDAEPPPKVNNRTIRDVISTSQAGQEGSLITDLLARMWGDRRSCQQHCCAHGPASMDHNLATVPN